MSDMLALPNEILQQIIGYVIPEDFEAIRLTCRSINTICAHFVSQHRDFVQRFRTWSPRAFNQEDQASDRDDDGTRSPTRSPHLDPIVELLVEIDRAPVIARYVQSLNVPRQTALDPSTENSLAHPQVSSVLEDVVRKSEFLSDIDSNKRRWIGTLRSQDHTVFTFYTILLLSMLPNLRVLGLSSEWRRGHDLGGSMSDELDALINKANSSKHQEAGLSKLTTVVPFIDFGYDYSMALDRVEPFLALNSVRHFHGASLIALDDGYTGSPFEPRYKNLGAGLETLELFDCVFGRQEMKSLLADMRCLKRLCVGLTTKWHGCGFNCNGGGIVGAILESPAAQTLTHLSLLCMSPWNECYTGVDSLTEFNSLRSLVIDLEYFNGAPYSLHKDFNDYDETFSDNEHDTDRATPRLDALLPASIESVELLIGYPDNQAAILNDLLAGLQEGQLRQLLPSLDQITLRVSPRWFERLDKTTEPWLAIFSTVTAIGAIWEFFQQDHCAESQDLLDFVNRFDMETV